MAETLKFILTLFTGGLVTWYFTSRKKLEVLNKTIPILTKNREFEHLKIFYKDTESDELMLTTVKLSNTGNKDIEKSDLRKNHISIIFEPNSSIFEHEIEIHEKQKDYIEPDYNIDENILNISFNHLSKKENFKINILHDSKINPVISCKLKNGKAIVLEEDKRKTNKEIKEKAQLLFVSVFVNMLLFIFVVSKEAAIDLFSTLALSENAHFGGIAFLIMTLTLTLVLLIELIRTINSRIGRRIDIKKYSDVIKYSIDNEDNKKDLDTVELDGQGE